MRALLLNAKAAFAALCEHHLCANNLHTILLQSRCDVVSKATYTGRMPLRDKMFAAGKFLVYCRPAGGSEPALSR